MSSFIDWAFEVEDAHPYTYLRMNAMIRFPEYSTFVIDVVPMTEWTVPGIAGTVVCTTPFDETYDMVYTVEFANACDTDVGNTWAQTILDAPLHDFALWRVGDSMWIEYEITFPMFHDTVFYDPAITYRLVRRA